MQQKAVVQHLSQRLQMLEKRLTTTPNVGTDSSDQIAKVDTRSSPRSTSIPSPEASLSTGDGRECEQSRSEIVFYG